MELGKVFGRHRDVDPSVRTWTILVGQRFLCQKSVTDGGERRSVDLNLINTIVLAS